MRSLDGNLYINAKHFGSCASQAGGHPGQGGNQSFSMGMELHGEAVDLCEVTGGRSVPVSLSCLSPLVEAELSRLVQLEEQRDHEGVLQSQPPSSRDWLSLEGQPKDNPVSEPSHHSSSFYCSS